MKVLITGANGFLASNLVRKFNELGISVKAMVRENSNLKSLEDSVYEKATGNLNNLSQMLEIIKDCDIIVHLAANTSQNSTYSEYELINVKATEKLIEAAQKSNIKKFIFVSTANAFENGTKENPGNENSEIMPWLKKSGYAYSKYIAQKLVLEKVEKEKFPAIVVNPTFMIGANDAKPSSGKIILMTYNKRIRFYPSTGGKNFVYVKDVAEGIVNAIEKGKTGESYLLAGENLSYKDFYKIIDDKSEIKAVNIPIPKFVLLSAGYIFTLIQNIFKFKTSFNYTNARMLCEGNYYTAKKAIEELNMPQTTIKKAVDEAIAWFKENKYMK